VVMRIKLNKPPRVFVIDKAKKFKMADCASIELKPDEQVTFLTPSGREYDVAAKSWGFYATPSINSRLKKQGFKTALVKNSQGRFFIMLVENEKIELFKRYLINNQNSKIICWLDEGNYQMRNKKKVFFNKRKR